MQIRTTACILCFCALVVAIALMVTHVFSWVALPADLFWQVFVLHNVILLSIALWGAFQIRRGTAGFDRLRHLADHDDMTGLLNRRRFPQLLAERDRAAGQVLILDIDHFKAIDDPFGHATGDQVIVAVARGLRNAVRAQDLVGRFGGEEFIVFLRATDQAGGLPRAELVRRHVEALPALLPPDGGGSEPPSALVTVSIGLVDLEPGQGVDASLGQADQALYAAKAAGRNRVRHFDLLPAENEIAKKGAAQ